MIIMMTDDGVHDDIYGTCTFLINIFNKKPEYVS